MNKFETIWLGVWCTVASVVLLLTAIQLLTLMAYSFL